MEPSAVSRLRADPGIWPNEVAEHMLNALARVASTHPGDFDYLSQAHLIAAPTLVIHGELDTIPIEASCAWASSIPNARLLVLPRVGHVPHVESPEAVFVAVDTFLGGAWPARATSPAAPLNRPTRDAHRRCRAPSGRSSRGLVSHGRR